MTDETLCKLFGHIGIRTVEVKDRVEWPAEMETTQYNIDNLAYPDPNGCCMRYRTYRRCLCGEHRQQVNLHYEEAK